MKRERADLAKVLEHYGIDFKDRSGNQPIKCPAHDDRSASASLNLEEGVWQCFACGKAGDSITLIQLREGVEVAEAFEFGQAFVAGGTGAGVRAAAAGRRPLAGGKGYRPRYRREVPARSGARKPFS